MRRECLEPHRAVNRFVLARSCVLVGALVAGGYVGYALTWLGVDTELATQRVWRSVAGGARGCGDRHHSGAARARVSRPIRTTKTPNLTSMSSPQARRRQRSTRLTVAVVLIVVAALAVAGAVLSGSWLFVTAAAVLGVVLGAVGDPHHPLRTHADPPRRRP